MSDSPSDWAIVFNDNETEEQAKALADSLALPYTKASVKDYKKLGYSLILVVEQDGLKLLKPSEKSMGALKVDFADGALNWRRQHGGGTGQPIAKAIGLKQKGSLNILDATAGTATDAFVLAALGCKVTMIERHPIVATMLEDALSRAEHQPDIYETTQNLTLLKGDSTSLLNSFKKDEFDVVYLDPMFPHSGKQAQVKKSMQYFRDMVGKDEDADDLLTPALKIAKYRVVVKRPRKSPLLNDQPPTLSLEGKANRFDIYVNKSLRD